MPMPPSYLRYPLEQVPEPGQTLAVADGLRWLRMPLPFMLGHINLWLLEDAGGLTVVDSGLNSSATRTHWRDVLAGHDLARVIVTHMHPDHVGSAGWLCEQHDCALWMTREEYLMCRVLVADTGQPAPQAGIDYYRAAGFDAAELERYIERFGGFGKAVYRLPDSYRRLQHGQTLVIGDRQWRVLTTSGHCPEHASLYCEADGLLIAGDQLLPTISSNVSVWPTEPEADPLGFWLESCRRLQREVAADVLVLPSHGKPFTGAHERLQDLIDEHESGLDKLLALCRKPQRAVDTFASLFKSRISEGNLIMATGEAIAHLNYLLHRGQLRRERDADGVYWYQS